MLQFVTIIFISQWNLNSFQLFHADKLEEYASLNILSKCSTLQKTKPAAHSICNNEYLHQFADSTPVHITQFYAHIFVGR